MQLSRTLVLITIALLVAAGAVFFVLKDRSLSGTTGANGSLARTGNDANRTYNPNIQADATDLYTSQDDLYSYVKKFGPKATDARLAVLSETQGSCHTAAHETGRFAYELLGDQAFQQCSAECHSGCYHGATEAFFRDHGTSNLAENLKIICSSAQNPFFSHQCIHGIGHGLMAWTGYGLFDALLSCDLLSERKDSCWTGVFMENIVGGLARADVAKNPSQADHFTKYLSDDPLYPCDDPKLDDKYKGSCYFLQTSRMLQIFGVNWDKVAGACSSAPFVYQQSCFQSMGRDVGGTYPTSAEQEITSCASAPAGELQNGCLIGAVQNTLWDPSGQDLAIHFCTLLTNKNEKGSCYTTIFQRAPDVFATASDNRAFCRKAESQYQSECVSYIH